MPRLRRLALATALLGTCGAATGAALAADQEVVARNSSFMPGQVELHPGDTLTIRHDDGQVPHNLQFTDEPTRRVEASTGWVVQRTFTAAEARDAPYTFFCSIHAGMTGSVTVRASAPTGTPTPTATASPGVTPAPTAGGPSDSGPSGGSSPAAATLRKATVAPRACMRRGPRCRRPGVRLRIDLSAPADVRGSLRRRAPGAKRFKAFGTVRFGTVAAGPRTLTFKRTAQGRRLRPGRYELVLRAAGERRTLSFRVL